MINRQLLFLFFRFAIAAFTGNVFIISLVFAWDPVSIATVPPLNGVWGNSGVVFAVGDSGTIISSQNSWQPMLTGVDWDFNDVWGSSATDVYAVGGHNNTGGGTIYHYDGNSWTQVIAWSYYSLQAVWGSSATDVYVAGGTSTFHFDGNEWRSFSSINGPFTESGWQEEWNDWEFTGVWGSSNANVQIVGGEKVLKYDGTLWSSMTGAASGANGIWDDLIVGYGKYYKNSSGTWQTHFSHTYSTAIWEDFAVSGNAVYRYINGDWINNAALQGFANGIHSGVGAIYIAGTNRVGTGALWTGSGTGHSVTPPTTTASPDGGELITGHVLLTATSNTAGVGIGGTYYTTDGTVPTEQSTLYTSAVNIDRDTTLKFFSVDGAGAAEIVRTKYFTVPGIINDPRGQGGPSDNYATAFSTVRPQGVVALPDYSVNTSTLNLSLKGLLFHASTRGAANINAEIYYNSDPSALQSNFGTSWRFSYEASLQLLADDRTILYRKGSGQVLQFGSPLQLERATADFPVILNPPAGYNETLVSYGSYCTLLEKSTRLTYRFIKNSGDLYYLTSITDQNGNVITVNTDFENGKLLSITDSANRSLSFTYNANNRCSRITVPGGRYIDFTYNTTSGNLTRIVDVENNTADFTYDADNYLTRSICEGHRTDFTYTSRGTGAGKYVSRVQDNLLGSTYYEFLSGVPRQVRSTSPEGKKTIYDSDDLQTNRVENPLGGSRQIGYTNHHVTQTTDGNNNVTKYEYDTYGNVSKTFDAYNKTTTYTYNADNLQLSKKNALNQTWTYTYDTNGNVTSYRTPLGHTSTMVYDSYGQMTSTTNPLGQTVSWTYDVFGNVTSITDSIGNITRFEYSTDGLRCIKITDAGGNTKDLDFDYYGRLTNITYETGVSVQNIFNAFYQTARVDENGNQTTQTRNFALSKTQTTYPLGNIWKSEFNTDNLMTKSIDGNNNATTYLYDDAGHLTRTTDPLDFTVNREYDDEGNMISLRDQRNSETTLTYDDNNKLSSISNPDGTGYRLTRDVVGRITQKTNGRGQTVGFTFNADGQRITKSYNGSSVASYTYDAVGNMLTMTDGSGVTSYTYTDIGKIATITWPGGKQVAFSYHSTGAVASVTYPDEMVLSYLYEARNRYRIPASLRMAASLEIDGQESPRQISSMNWSSRQLDMTYDNASRITAITRPNGTSTTFSVDANNRITGVNHLQKTTPFLSLNYGLDNADQTTDAIDTTNLLPPVDSYTYTGSYNTSNQITTWDSDAYTYDADGNLTGAGDSFAAVYDVESRPTSITLDGVTTSYLYNANGLKVRRTRGGVITNYHYDHKGRVLFTTNGAGDLLVNYLYNKKHPVAFGLAVSGFHYFHYSRTGNTRAITNDAGDVVSQYTYLPYGQYSQQGSSFDNPFTYVGAHGVMDEGNGHFYMKNRYYDALSRHFLQRDPIGFDGGINLYLYSGANPVNYIDPEGTFFNIAYMYMIKKKGVEEDERRSRASRDNSDNMETWLMAYEKKKTTGKSYWNKDSDPVWQRGQERMDRLYKIQQTDSYKTAGGNLKLMADTAEEITKETAKAVVAGTVGAGLGLGAIGQKALETGYDVIVALTGGVADDED